MTKLSSVALGRGEVRLDDYTAWQDQNTSALSSSYNLGICYECALNNELEFRTKRSVENISDIKKIFTKNNVFLETTILNATKSNLNLLLTGNHNDLQEFYFGGVLFDSEYRLEVKFLYPNKIDYMVIILPKVKIISTSDLNLVNLSEPNKPSFEFQSFPIENNAWGKDLGKVEFGQQ